MSSNTIEGSTVRIASAGHAAFAAILIGLGILGLVKGDFTAVWQPWTKSVPAREGLVYLSALVSLLSGIGLFWRRTVSLTACVLLAFLVLWLVLLTIPGLFF